MLIDEEVAIHLRESKLTEDQQLKLLDSGQSLFKATVRDTGQLRWWLLGFADQIEVLQPESLRQWFGGKTALMAAKYQRDSTLLTQGVSGNWRGDSWPIFLAEVPCSH